ncbi:MAG: hypothetical protein COT81_05860 [Candidatus Buchananbacteria bacterium CG10_big_fil_rev_8_21_14_0_10_42_9]|uniref:Type II toxin-antitoxin system HicA family toxin n=1 Tax=Candidatus Buchananbacteria bacterium CG10_big_fil_rev_8_21_14_0_10_42_9 TaxID=1974526 RepID=A0A2H0VZL8_9BACT|nr:MAG: hypothetical protein COT81_05860 [Candidatus Buchananbacteria bacterium CG10_big_fil_rev_8_21_14_0_10_42_9]
MPRDKVPSDTTQRKVLKAFRKLGFEILPHKYGKGSHRMVRDPKTGQEITVQSKVFKQVLFDYCSKVSELGYDVNQFIKHL